MQQEQRLSGAAPVVRHGHGAGPRGESTLNETVPAMLVLPG
ncbi:hypothetical protein ACFCZY_08365 [Streptomyces sp. NPDC056237]